MDSTATSLFEARITGELRAYGADTDRRGGREQRSGRARPAAATAFYWKLTILACLGGFLFGYDTSNIGAALNFVPYHLSSFWLGYLVAGASLGAAAGAIMAGPVADRFGRKALLITDALSMLQQWMITVGILISYVIALIILKLLPNSAGTLDWRLILGIGAVPALIGLALRTQMPESPRWLLRQGKYEKVRDTLQEFGAEVSTEDVEQTARQLVCMFFVFQQITGINIPLYYGPHLLGPLFGTGHSEVSKTISGVEVTALMTVVNVAATYFAFRYIDKVGRRKLAIGGYIGMALFALLAAAGLGFFTGTTRIVVVMIGLSAFIASFAVGVGGTGWLLQGEVSPPRSVARPRPRARPWTGWPTSRSSRSSRSGRGPSP